MRLLWWSLKRLGGLGSVGSRRLVSHLSVHMGHLWPKHSLSTFRSPTCSRFAPLQLALLTLHLSDQSPCAFPLPSLSFLFLLMCQAVFDCPSSSFVSCLSCLLCRLSVCSVCLSSSWQSETGDKCMGSGPHQISLSSLPFPLFSLLFALSLLFPLFL